MSAQTIEEFIKKANKVHKNFYDYSKVIYTNSYTKITIICPDHGEFEQLPYGHLYGQNPRKPKSRGYGCSKCSKYGPFIFNDFIKKANKVHKNFYDYSKSIYKSNKQKITIICPDHGKFEQDVNVHLTGAGCRKCARNEPYTTKSYIKKANEVHNNFYDYSKTVYTVCGDKITVICPDHGKFKVKANGHLSGRGCVKCTPPRIDTDDLIKKMSKIHKNFYDYSLVEYVNSWTKIKIICPKHGKFEQDVHGHLTGSRCGKCSKTISRPEIAWLDKLKIPDKLRQYELDIDDKKIKVDACQPRKKIVYEFLGDFWHGNPRVFDKNKLNTRSNKTFGQLYKETHTRFRKLRKLGYKVVYIWESDWNKQQKMNKNIDNQ